MVNQTYTVDERIWLVEKRIKGYSYPRIRDHFSVLYPHRPIPAISTISAMYNKFKQTGNLDPSLVKVHQPNRVLSEDTRFDIFASVIDDSSLSLSKIANNLNVSESSIRKVLHEEKFRSYKMSCHQQLTPLQDTTRRMTFCAQMQEMLNNDAQLLARIIFSDECTFHISHGPNRQNTRFWCTENPHIVVQNRTQYQAAVNVWAGMVGQNIIGPFFIENRLNQFVYLDLLQNQVLPAIRQLPDNVC